MHTHLIKKGPLVFRIGEGWWWEPNELGRGLVSGTNWDIPRVWGEVVEGLDSENPTAIDFFGILRDERYFHAGGV